MACIAACRRSSCAVSSNRPHWRALAARRQHPALFAGGKYTPLLARGDRADNLFAFARRDDERVALVAVPRLTTRLVEAGGLPLGSEVWGDTELELDGVSAGETFRCVFSGSRVRAEAREGSVVVRAAEVFAGFPVAILLND